MSKPATHQERVSVVIVCWNNRDLLQECLESVYAQTYPNCDIIVVDNGSTDDSVDYIKRHHSKVKLVETGENLGFAIGNNIGIKEAFKDPACRYVMLLNTDATTDPDWIETMVAFAKKHPKLASVQSPTVDYYDHSVLDSCGILVDRQALATQMGYRQTNVQLETRQVFGVNAAAALFTRNFLDAQPFGEDYLDHDLWMYLEDVDIAARATMMGWENWFLNESRAYHMGSASSGKNPGFSLYMTYRNNALMLIKNLPRRIIIRTLPGMMRAELNRLRGFWREGKYSLIKMILKGRFKSLRLFPLFFRKRREFKKYWSISEAELWKLMEIPKLAKIPPKERPYGTETVTAIILSHNNMGRLESCLEAVAGQKYPNLRIIVVDNHSTDGSLQFLEEKYPDIPVLAQKANLGTANGFNVGITKAMLDEPDYFALIQANTVVEPGWIDTMVETIRKRTDAFAIASKLMTQVKPDQPEIVLNQGYDYRPGQDVTAIQFEGSSVKEVFAVSDYASFHRTEGMGSVGILDGDFFDGLEDVDWCFRAHLANRKVYSQPRAKAHVALEPRLSEAARWYQRQKNLFYIYVKDLSFKLFWKYLPAAIGFTVHSYVMAFQKGFIVQQIKALLKCSARLPRMLRYRRHINTHRRARAVEVDRALQRNFAKE